MNKKEKLALMVLVAILVGYGVYQTAFAISSYKWGYTNGLKDGKASERDEVGTCEDIFTNSTHDYHTCYHGYNLGFKEGCDLIGNTLPGIPEFGNCTEYFNSNH